MTAGDGEAGPALIWCPFADEAEAKRVARAVIEERLVACANLIGSMTSIFAWEGRIDEARECGALFKTTVGALPAAAERIAALHPYDSPAVIGWRADAAPPATLEWLAASVARVRQA